MGVTARIMGEAADTPSLAGEEECAHPAAIARGGPATCQPLLGVMMELIVEKGGVMAEYAPPSLGFRD